MVFSLSTLIFPLFRENDGFSSITWYYRCWRFSLISSLFHSLVLVTLFIFCITTFYITFIREKKKNSTEKNIQMWRLLLVCVRFLFFLYINYFVYERWTSLFFFFIFSLLLKVELLLPLSWSSIEKNKTSYMLFHFFFLVEKLYLSLHMYINGFCLSARAHDVFAVVKNQTARNDASS